MTRRLTKSRFKLASECPTKLFYTRKRDVYPDKSYDDSFLAALAEGGNQVGELATLYHPGGTMVKTLNEADALAQTADLLNQENAIIYEAAVLFENLFIRVDVLVKRGRRVDLIEVKAKSCSAGGAEQFMGKRGGLLKEHRPYIEDVTFQKYVLQSAFPTYQVTAYLMLMDKSVPCPTDGLHQKFLLVEDADGRADVQVTADLSEAELGTPLLRAINVDELAEGILGATDHGPDANLSYGMWVASLADFYGKDRKLPSPIGAKCGSCNFHATDAEKAAGLESGLEECWSAAPEWTEPSFAVPKVLDLGGFQGKQALIQRGVTSLLQVTPADLKFNGDVGDKMTAKERQWLHVRSVQEADTSMHLRKKQLRDEIATWKYPLHFIDFETAAPAIPFHKGLRAYESLGFQFSHHTVFEDGRVEHSGEYIDVEPGHFPSYDFVRALKLELEGDDGSIFKYSPHENTILSIIRSQLIREEQPPSDRDDLVAFIESIAHPTGSVASGWPTPKRDMIDMLVTVKDYYYDPAMGGSKSIKKVLPAILNGSDFLQAKYSEPIYGADGGVPSLNFTDKVWVERDGTGRVRDPYQLLPNLFEDLTREQHEMMVSKDEALADGGAAMTAFARLQFTEMQDRERDVLREALLMYCELDTLAMVMIFEAWKDWTGAS